MKDFNPRFFYKYRAIKNLEDLDKDYSLKGLFENQAIFSCRDNFNDLFDCKIELIPPCPKQLKNIKKTLSQKERIEISRLCEKGKITNEGKIFIENLEENFKQLVDGYFFYCVTANCKSNLMWSHYADSHRGFCIEFRPEHMDASKVLYKADIPELKLIDIICSHYDIPQEKHVGDEIWHALRTKLEEWKYEEEYRFQLGYDMSHLIIEKNDKFSIVSYEPYFVESIIFGCRMSEKIKNYIIKNMPKETKFKQAIEEKSSIKITNYKS
jgi:Protein of unknown function (DUF2971)